MKRETLRRTIAVFTSLISILLMTLLVGIILASLSFSSRSAITSAIKASDFVSNRYAEFLVRSGNILEEYGAPSERVDTIFTKQQFAADLQTSIDASYRNRDPEISFSTQRNELHRVLEDFILSEGLTYTDEIEAGIEEMILRIEQTYRSSTAIPYMRFYHTIRQRYNSYSPYLYLGLLVCFLGSLVFLYKIIQLKSFLKTSVLLLASCGWIYLVVPGFLLFNGFYDRISIRPMSIQRLVATLTKSLLVGSLGIGFSLVLLSTFIYLYLNHQRPKTIEH